MLKIIEPGNIFRIKCPECNCLFQYEKEDTFIDRIGMDECEIIECPQCDSKILLATIERETL